MCVYVYLCVCAVPVSVSVPMCVSVSASVYVYVYVPVSLSVCVASVSVFEFVFVCACRCVRVCMRESVVTGAYAKTPMNRQASRQISHAKEPIFFRVVVVTFAPQYWQMQCMGLQG